MKLSKTTIFERVEGFGLFLILLSFFIQLTENNIEEDIREAQHNQTQTKLDKIWFQINTISSNLIETKPNFSASSKSEWKYYPEDKSYLDNWKTSVFYETISYYRIWIFVFGSMLIIIPKFVKLK